MDSHFYKLTNGIDVFHSLNEISLNNKSTSFLISAVGDLSRVSFKCPLNDKPVIIEKKLEIITLTGYLKNKESHVHVSVSDETCSVLGGHLLPGSIVLNSLDILISSFPELNQDCIKKFNNNCSNVAIYVLPDCPWSKRALKLLDSFHVKYNYHLISNDSDFKMISDLTSINTFPQIFINNKFIGGYSELSNLASNGYFD